MWVCGTLCSSEMNLGVRRPAGEFTNRGLPVRYSTEALWSRRARELVGQQEQRSVVQHRGGLVGQLLIFPATAPQLALMLYGLGLCL